MKKVLIFLCAVLSLAACSSDHSGSGDGDGRQPRQQTGYYKVGRPYEVSGETYTPKEDYAYDETGIASWYGPGFHGGKTANGETYDTQDLTAAHRTLPLPSLVRVTNIQNGKSVVARVNDRGPFARGRIIDVSKKVATLLDFIGSGTAKVRVQMLAKESQALQDAAKKGVIITDISQYANAQANDASDEIVTDNGTTVISSETIQTAEAVPAISIETEELVAPASVPIPSRPGNEKAVLAKTGLDKNLVGSFDEKNIFQPAPSVRQLDPHPNSRIYIQAGAFASAANAERLKARLDPLGKVNVTAIDKSGKTFYRVRVGPIQNVADADNILAKAVKAGADGARTIIDY